MSTCCVSRFSSMILALHSHVHALENNGSTSHYGRSRGTLWGQRTWGLRSIAVTIIIILPARELRIILPINRRVALRRNPRRVEQRAETECPYAIAVGKLTTRVGLSPRVKKLTASVRSLHTSLVSSTRYSPKNPKNNTNSSDRLTGRFKKRLRAPANYRQNPISNFPENVGLSRSNWQYELEIFKLGYIKKKFVVSLYNKRYLNRVVRNFLSF